MLWGEGGLSCQARSLDFILQVPLEVITLIKCPSVQLPLCLSQKFTPELEQISCWFASAHTLHHVYLIITESDYPLSALPLDSFRSVCSIILPWFYGQWRPAPKYSEIDLSFDCIIIRSHHMKLTTFKWVRCSKRNFTGSTLSNRTSRFTVGRSMEGLQ